MAMADLCFPCPSFPKFPRFAWRPISRKRPGSLTLARNSASVESGDNAKRFNGLEVLYDDGQGTVDVRDYIAAAKAVVESGDGGPPRWFCPADCGQPIENAPVMFYLPGIDGSGMGIITQSKSLGKVFEVRCLHIPVNDRTSFEGLVKFVRNSIKNEHVISPKKPIYLVGDALGGCLALAVAAHNPSVDLILILVNPAKSFSKSELQPFVSIIKALPSDILGLGDSIKMAVDNFGKHLNPLSVLEESSERLVALPILRSDLADILPLDTLLWKLMLLKSGSSYSNSRLHAVKAEVLLLSSWKDSLLQSQDEASRLQTSLKNCRVRYFNDSGNALLLEDGFNLLNVIKSTALYRRSKQHDFVTDYLPPTISDFRKHYEQETRLYSVATSAVMLSTLGNGQIVKGLHGVPDEGPVLLVGYHNLLALEVDALLEAFIKEKNIVFRGLGHPILFSEILRPVGSVVTHIDRWPIFGGLPVSATHMYRLFSRKSFVLLYPGGIREALHLKGEEYKLFWPDQPEFVRMAARFGATIVPFGVVGEDDILQVLLDYDDQMRIPFFRELIQTLNEGTKRLRSDADGEVSKQRFHIPGVLPKLPGRVYCLFGKPIETKGQEAVLRDRERANELYLQIQSEIVDMISYLKKKREEDPYRSIVQRSIYQNLLGRTSQIPTFEP